MAGQPTQEAIDAQQSAYKAGMFAWVRIFGKMYDNADGTSITQYVRFYEERPNDNWKRTTVDFYVPIESTKRRPVHSFWDFGCTFEVCAETDEWANEVTTRLHSAGCFPVHRYKKDEAGEWKFFRQN